MDRLETLHKRAEDVQERDNLADVFNSAWATEQARAKLIAETRKQGQKS